MTDFNPAAAWARLTTPLPRRTYEHVKAHQKRDRRRRNFLRRIERRNGCWVWTGQKSERRGRSYPLVSFREPDGRRVQKLAFRWMVEEFFPEFQPMISHRTSPSCDEMLCINPWHRVDSRVTRQSITADQARAIYAERGKRHRAQVAADYGISADHVQSIWRGRSWSRVTGQAPPRPIRRVYSDDEVQRVMDLKGAGSSRQVGAQLGVHHKFVLAVWAGLRTKQGA